MHCSEQLLVACLECDPSFAFISSLNLSLGISLLPHSKPLSLGKTTQVCGSCEIQISPHTPPLALHDWFRDRCIHFPHKLSRDFLFLLGMNGEENGVRSGWVPLWEQEKKACLRTERQKPKPNYVAWVLDQAVSKNFSAVWQKNNKLLAILSQLELDYPLL